MANVKFAFKNCNLCGSNHKSALYPRVVRCEDCGYVFTDPQLSETALEEYYSGAYIQASVQTPTLRDQIFEPPFLAALNRSRELGFVMESQNFGRLLDLGAAWGGLLYLAREKGFDCYGVEIAKPNVAFAQKELGLNVFAGQLREAGFAPAFFDAVIAVHMLEHTPDPRGTFAEIHRILKPGGVFVGIVPNFNSYLRRQLGEKWLWLTPEDHYSHFTEDVLRQELSRLGFSVSFRSEEGHYGPDALRSFADPQMISELVTKRECSEIIFCAHKPA